MSNDRIKSFNDRFKKYNTEDEKPEVPFNRTLMSEENLMAFMSKDSKDVFIYKRFETELNDVITLVYNVPNLLETSKINTKNNIALIEKIASKEKSERVTKHRRDISNKEDKDMDETELLTMTMIDANKLLSKEIKKSNDIQTEGLINARTLFSEAEKKLYSAKSRQASDLIKLEAIYESDITIIDDTKRDDIRMCKQKQKSYADRLFKKIKTSLDSINAKYPKYYGRDIPAGVISMEPVIELSESKTDPEVIIPLNILDFVKNKLIKLTPNTSLNKKKYGELFEEEQIEADQAELIRLENKATILDKKRQAEKEAKKKAEEEAEAKKKAEAEAAAQPKTTQPETTGRQQQRRR